MTRSARSFRRSASLPSQQGITGDRGGSEGPLAEFVALRQEIERRNVVQHGLFALQLTSAGAIFSFALSGSGRSGFLLIVPISSYMLCARYVEQQLGIQRAATYIKTELSQKIPGGLGWEAWQVKQIDFVRGSTIRRVNSLLIVFPVVGTGALIGTVDVVLRPSLLRLDLPESIGFDVLWVLGLLAAVMCVQMIWSMLRHPLGDASLPPLYRLPAEFRRPSDTEPLKRAR